MNSKPETRDLRIETQNPKPETRDPKQNSKPETRNPKLSVLLIEDSPVQTRRIRDMLAEVRGTQFVLECAGRLSAGLERLSKGGIDIVLLDLMLPDSEELETLLQTHGQAPDVPIVVLTGLDDEALAVKAMQEGAQDYLVKDQLDASMLGRTIRYAIQRHRLLAEVERHAAALEQSNAELTSRKAFLAAILDSTVDAILTVDEHAVIRSLNKKTIDLFGYDEDELVGKSLDILVSGTTSSDIVKSLLSKSFLGGGGGVG